MAQAIADRLAGIAAPHLKARAFVGPYREIWQALDNADPGMEQETLHRVLQDSPERDALIGAILGARPGGYQRYPSLLELAKDLQPVRWLWQDWIPRGMLTLLGAVPGAGKSYVSLDLARRLIEGTTYPDGSPIARPAPVVYIDAEAIPQVINERAKNWGMNRGDLYLMLPTEDYILDLSEEPDQYRLIEMCYALGPDLVVVDSLSSVSTKGENNVEDIRNLLAFLNKVAVEYDCGMLLIHHLRKKGGQQGQLWSGVTADDFRGSGHIIAMARSVLGLSIVQTGSEIDRNGPRKLELVKTNLTRYPDALGIEFEPLHPQGVRLVWGPAPEAYTEPTKFDECKDWLEETLKGAAEPLKPKELVEEAKAAGFSRSMLYRVRDELTEHIQNTEGRQHPDNAWEWVD
jgi:hypothetical protein